MNDKNPLYEDPDIRIEVMHHNSKGHCLYLLGNGEESQYIIPRGVLSEFATTPRDALESKMRNFNEPMVVDAIRRRLSVDSLGFAMAQACSEEERRDCESLIIDILDKNPY